MKIIKESDLNAIELACDFLRQGKVISFASDTVYGVAADARNYDAVNTLYEIKNRDVKKPIAIFVKDLKTAEEIFDFDELAKKVAREFLPGALTLVLKTKENVKNILAENLNQNDDKFLGFRIVEKKFIKNLLQKFDGILAVTSANKSNHEASINANEVKKYFTNSKLALLIDGGISKEKTPSTVAKISDKKITILRQGLINIS